MKITIREVLEFAVLIVIVLYIFSA